MDSYFFADPLQSQCSPGSGIFPQSDERRWVGAAGQSWVQLPRAGPMTSPGKPYHTYHENTPDYQVAFQTPTSSPQQVVPWVPHPFPQEFPNSTPSSPIISPPGPASWNPLAWMSLQSFLPPNFPLMKIPSTRN
ncbi:hypothetical protein FA13DRAFT_1774422, partial [Coprinellus micaceus]